MLKKKTFWTKQRLTNRISDFSGYHALHVRSFGSDIKGSGKAKYSHDTIWRRTSATPATYEISSVEHRRVFHCAAIHSGLQRQRIHLQMDCSGKLQVHMDKNLHSSIESNELRAIVFTIRHKLHATLRGTRYSKHTTRTREN